MRQRRRPQAHKPVLVVYKRSNLESYLYVTRAQPNQRRERLKRVLMRAHRDHGRTLELLRAHFKTRGQPVRFVRRDRLGVFRERDYALVVSAGGDGTLLSTAPYLHRTPVFAINSAPNDSVGFFAAATAENFSPWLDRILAGEAEPAELARMAVRVNGALLPLPVLNDVLMAHPSPGATSRLLVLPPGEKHGEEQRSSGLWVSTAAGSSSALRSAGGPLLPLYSRDLAWVIREPYVAARGPRYLLREGLVRAGERLTVEARVERCALYLDGPATHVPLSFGDRVAFSAHPKTLRVFGYSPSMQALHQLDPKPR